jgi:hypothetical protein
LATFLPIGDNEGAAPVASISATMLPARDGVAKFLLDLIAFPLYLYVG